MDTHNYSRTLPGDLMAPPMVERWKKLAFPIAGVFTVAAIIGAFVGFAPFLRAYVTGYMLCIGASMGSMALLMVQHLVGGKWGIVNRRVFEAAAKNIGLMAVLFIPIAVGAKSIYAWMSPLSTLTEEAAHAAHWKHAYLNYPFWIGRAVICFAIWWFYANRLTRMSVERDADTRDSLLRWQTRFENLSGFGLVVYAITLTIASVDWVMSMDVTWFSTMYGLIYLVGQGLTALALGIICSTLLSREEPMASVLRVRELHDNGKLLFAFVMLFAYVSFSQFLILWSANLPEEISWYNQRIHGGWGYIAVAVIAFHFALPWLVLLSRDIKRHSRALRRIAYFMIFMRFVDLFWNVEPFFSRNEAGKWVSVNFINAGRFSPHFHLPWQYAVVPIALGCWWWIGFLRNLQQVPLIPINDPQIHEIFEPEHGHAAV
ncbi:MAG: hypothetical protein NVS9B15_02430 [Acidobacteriaceae bacterium]